MTTESFVPVRDVLKRTETDTRPWCVSSAGVKTFGDLRRAAAGYKAAFEAAGVKRAAVFSPEIFTSSAALFGAWAAGVTAVLPADTTPATCARLRAGVADAAAGDFPGDSGLTVIEPVAAAECEFGVLEENAELLELFTSGSTGTPTAVIKRLRQLFCEVESIEKRQSDAGVDPDAVILSTVSQQHIYGLLFFLLWPIASARPVWHRRVTTPEGVIDLAGCFEKSAWIASPAHLTRLPETPDWEKTKGRLQIVMSSGGPLAENGVRDCLRLTGLSPVELLGSSESGGIAWRSRGVASDGTMTGTAWRALPGVVWKCADGLLALKSEQLYHADWEVTNDKIAPLPDGLSFEHLGRADRIAKVEEKRLSLTAMEKALTDSGIVSAARAFQLPDAHRTLAVAAELTQAGLEALRSEGKAALVKRLRHVLAQSFEAVCLPRRWRFVTELPQNSMGKITMEALTRLFDPRTVQFAVAKREGDAAEILLTVPAKSPYFEGHFPEFALLPGVCQAEWSVRMSEAVFGRIGLFSGIRNLKFMQPVRPNTTVVVTMTRVAGKAAVDFVWAGTQGALFGKGRLMFEGKADA